ncbi:hypothetical protein A9Q68_09020 [Streptococcus bovimastitidis]|uniref:EamA domain-containing protein n=1 Tax=Streptococcus bovimastitidis TaxID=1856638 RepID=A0A1L8MKN5_9STRE|nr:DMT family transporter [Streptococcus bovimastitidis]OJF71327.1 hypothetical protein A9Q68_09020 [Streptococcus bovimastitidis]
MNNHSQKNILLGCLSAFSCEVLFGLSYLFTKEAASQASAMALLGWRFALALAVMLVMWAFGLISLNLKKKGLGQAILLGLFSPVLYFVGETFGIKSTTASESGVFLATIPVVTLLMAILVLKDKPTKGQMMGISLTVLGVLISVFAVGVQASFSFFGYAMLLLAVLSYAFYCVLVEKSQAFSGVELTFVMILVGFCVFSTLAIIEGLTAGKLAELWALPLQQSSFGMAVLYQGIACSVLAFFLSNYAISQLGVNRTASFIGVSTAVAILSGVLLLGESFTFIQILGVLLIMLGVYISNRG